MKDEFSGASGIHEKQREMVESSVVKVLRSLT